MLLLFPMVVEGECVVVADIETEDARRSRRLDIRVKRHAARLASCGTGRCRSSGASPSRSPTQSGTAHPDSAVHGCRWRDLLAGGRGFENP